MAAEKPLVSGKDEQLTADQAHALLDILSHAEVYQEIQDFRSPTSLEHYGPPFTHESGKSSSFPSLQALVSNFLLQLPGFRDISAEFWTQRVAAIVTDLEKAELSESYDKGLIGIRKTLSTAISALIEYPVRGCFAGFQEPNPDDDKRQYDISNPEDLQRAFRDLMYRAVYGRVIDDLFVKAAETEKLSEHPQLIQAAHEYVLVNMASFMHYTLILSPKGQQLLSLIDRANKLVPYTIIKQTLRIGNVASMINGMTKIILAKMSMASVTNWIGLTKGEDEGQNLLQHVISQTLQWDIRDLKSKASKIEKHKDGPMKEQLEGLKAYLEKSHEEHETLRKKSQQNKQSIVFVILSDASMSTSMTPQQHNFAQQYLSIQLSIRDREQIVKVLCRSQPDHLTQSVRDGVSAYEPVIRHIHDAVDLAETIGDLEKFINDMIKLSKMPNATEQRTPTTVGKSSSKPLPPIPTVGDFVQLLKKHQYCSHKFIHQCAKNGKEVTQWFHDYALESVAHFRRRNEGSSTTNPSMSSTSSSGAGSLTEPLNEMLASLDPQTRKTILSIADQRATYLSHLHASSAARLRSVVTSPHSNHPALASSSTTSRAGSRVSSRASSPARGYTGTAPTTPAEVNPGPGAYLARWQALMDGTLITPAVAEGGDVRTGNKGSVLRASRAAVDDEDEAGMERAGGMGGDDEEGDDVFEDAREKIETMDLGTDAGSGSGGGGGGAAGTAAAAPGGKGKKIEAPDDRIVVEKLGAMFRDVLAERGCTW